MISAVDEARFINLVNSGMRNVDIATELSISQQYVSSYKSKLRLFGKLPKATITMPENKKSASVEPKGMFDEIICPVCKKRFYRTFGWVYKRKSKTNSTVSLCSYGCCRKVDKGEAKL